MNDGFLELWIGGNLMQTLSGIDNDTVTINGVKLGAVGYLDSGTSGTIYFDQFKSTRGDTEIGLAFPEEAMLYNHGTGAASSLKTEVSITAKYVYDGDGNMVMSIINGVITYYPGRHYQTEVNGETVTTKKYYTAAGMTVAMRTIIQGGTDTLNWLLSDHLGSTSITANADGTLLAKVKYTAFGEVRSSTGTTPTDYLYTGQLSDSYINLYWYSSRWYDSQLAHFVQADTIIPNAGSSKSYDRYAYSINNPLRYNDPSGHSEDDCNYLSCDRDQKDQGWTGGDGNHDNYHPPVPEAPIENSNPTPDFNQYPIEVFRTQVARIQTPYPQRIIAPPTQTPDTTPPEQDYEWALYTDQVDWIDAGVDVVGIVGDVALFLLPADSVLGVVTYGVSEVAETVGAINSIDKLVKGYPEDAYMDFTEYILTNSKEQAIDAGRLIPLVGIVFNLVSLGDNILPNVYVRKVNE